MKLFLLSVLLIGLAFAGIAIKIWVKKGGEFSGTCASQSPFLNKDGEPCGLCGKMPSQQKDCDLPHPQHN
jgi:hypothetical protein